LGATCLRGARSVVASGMRAQPGVALCAPALLRELDHAGVDAAAVAGMRAACLVSEGEGAGEGAGAGGRGLHGAWRLLTFRPPHAPA